MKLKQLFILDCTEAARYCDKAQYREASFFERIKLKLHHKFCEACKEYDNENSKLTSLIKKAGIQTCTEEEKEAFRKHLATQQANQTPKERN